MLELHGTVHEVLCTACGARMPIADVLARIDAGEPDPACLLCGGVLKTATVYFGEVLDADVLDAAARAAADCDVLLAAGTSLGVHPAAGLVEVAAAHGARIVLVNAEPTPYDGLADLVVREPIGTALPALLAPAR